MTNQCWFLRRWLRSLILLVVVFAATQAQAQGQGRVAPAALPLPLPGTTAVPPDRLRAANPWNLPMTGEWRFQLTRGRMVAGFYVSAGESDDPIVASSNEDNNPPENAFDGKKETRWCADSDAFPQFLRADLGKAYPIANIDLAWERSYERYRCRIEGSLDGKKWVTLADATASPGIGDGPVALGPHLTGTTTTPPTTLPSTTTLPTARYVRITVVGSQGGWASLREFQIQIEEAGKIVTWRPPAPRPVQPSPHAADFAQPGYDDTNWNRLAVPSNWEMAGYSIPTYNAVDNTVGLYRRSVTIPKAWEGRRIYWRFDGALDGAEIYINGRRAGYHESGYTAFDVDLTGLVRPGESNLFAVRVCKSTPSSDCETGDFQAMGGIYRETSLIAVPATHIHDITVRTPLSADYRDATLNVGVQVQGTADRAVQVAGTLVGADGQPVAVRLTGQGRIGHDGSATLTLSAPVQGPKLWSAEKPNLYYLLLDLTQDGKTVERVEQRFGFRQVEIKNNIVLWNGRPIKCTGVCRHDFWASRGFALTDTEWRKDLALMKAANINAIRTSHYNHAARFLELCDEQGMYILDEVPFCWIGNKVKDPAFAAPLLLRTADTIGRDKNRACVLAWSLGNENPLGPDQQQVRDLARQLDPTRPAFVSQMAPWDLKGQDFRDMHYPSPGDVDHYVKEDSGKGPAVFSEHPHIFYQKETQDYDPGASDLWSETLIKTWDRLWKEPNILGSFIWEWQNQGIADKYPDKTRDFYYGPDHLRQENNKGIVDAYRNPKPEWWVVRSAYSPIAIAERTVTPDNGSCTVNLTNHYAFTDLKELSCRWSAMKGTTTLKTGVMHVACGPGEQARAQFPAPEGMTALRLEFDHAVGGSTGSSLSSLVSAELRVAGAPTPAPLPALAGGDELRVQEIKETQVVVSNPLHTVSFDAKTGAMHWQVKGQDRLEGPQPNLGTGKAGRWNGYYRSDGPLHLTAPTLTWQHRPDGSVGVVVTGALRADGGQSPGTLTCTYIVRPYAEIAVSWSLDWTAPETRLWEAGLTFALPATLSQMAWWRESYFADYPAGHPGEPTGTCRAGDTLFRSSKRALHWLTLTDPQGAGVELLADESQLIGRATPGTDGITLYASREVAGPQDFSGNWVSEHDIIAVKGKPLTGSFILRATGR